MGFCPPNVRASLAERWQYKLPWLATEAVSLQRETARSSWDYSAARFRGLHPPNFWFENKFVQVLWTSGRGCVVTVRGDLNLLSNEARKKYPAVREVWKCGNRIGCSWECLKILCLTSHGVYCLSCSG